MFVFTANTKENMETAHNFSNLRYKVPKAP